MKILPISDELNAAMERARKTKEYKDEMERLKVIWNNPNVQWDRAQYWDKPWNPWIGCRMVSPACMNCYANTISKRFNMSEDFSEPRRTTRTQPPSSGVVFAGNMTDLFGEWLTKEDIRHWTDVMLSTAERSRGKATYMALTKRVERFSSLVTELNIALRSPKNVYWGFTAESQEWYDQRLRHFPTSVQSWVSVEPLLGEIDLHFDDLKESKYGIPFKWVVVGCESGTERRPCRIEWVESIVDQCVRNGVKVFVKQLDINGECERDIVKFPKDLQIRQVPWLWQNQIQALEMR